MAVKMPHGTQLRSKLERVLEELTEKAGGNVGEEDGDRGWKDVREGKDRGYSGRKEPGWG